MLVGSLCGYGIRVCFGQKNGLKGQPAPILLILGIGTLVLACGFLVSLRFQAQPAPTASCAARPSECASSATLSQNRPFLERRAVGELLAGMPYDCLWGAANNVGYLNRVACLWRSLEAALGRHARG